MVSAGAAGTENLLQLAHVPAAVCERGAGRRAGHREGESRATGRPGELGNESPVSNRNSGLSWPPFSSGLTSRHFYTMFPVRAVMACHLPSLPCQTVLTAHLSPRLCLTVGPDPTLAAAPGAPPAPERCRPSPVSGTWCSEELTLRPGSTFSSLPLHRSGATSCMFSASLRRHLCFGWPCTFVP